MKTKITITFILWGVICAYGQVSTKFFNKGGVFEKNSQFKKSLEKEYEKVMPTFDISELLREDEANKDMDTPFRFGKSIDVDLGLQDGKWEKTDSTEVWKLKITSKGAYSLNFIFSTLYLPKGGELNIFNEDGSILYGPLTEKQNQHGKKFLTDIIQGESAIICITTPVKPKEKPELTIQNVIHGYRNICDFMDIGYGTSGSCNNNVACHTDWSTESDGVVQILLSTGTELCSGSMLNNTNQDYRPFILTAFHCIDTGKNLVLEQNEINEAQEWLVRFRFRHKYCTNSDYIFDDVITYDDTQFRAAWNEQDGSDFALVELQDCIAGDTYNRVTWLGWDRSNSTSSSGAGIHHPSGDVMKISFYNTSSTIDGNFMNFQFYDGVVEPGSSGSPIFNSNKRVIGQLNGTPSADPISCSNQDGIARYGRFFSSWTGGNTNTTRLSNWLDPGSTGAMTLNTIRGPIISGANLVCTSGTSYTISNLPSGRTVSWTCTSINNNLAIDPTTGSAHATSSTPGQGTISAVLNTGCGNVTLPAKSVWVGAPVISSISGPTSTPNNQWATYHAILESDLSAPTAYNWILNPLNGNSVYNYGSTCDVAFYNTGYYQLVVQAKNVCSSPGYGPYYWTGINVYNSYRLTVSPNPSTAETTLSLVDETNKTAQLTTDWNIDVYDSFQGLKEKKTKLKTTETKINTSGWKEGVYIIRATIGDKVLTEKMVVKH